MEEEKRKAYSEVVEILKLIEDEKRIEKIPFEVIELIKRNSDPLYKPNIDKNKPIEEQGLRNETYSILMWIANKYWNENIGVEPTKQEVGETNNLKQEEKTINNTVSNIDRKAAVYNDISPEILEKCDEQEKLPILSSDIKWYDKIKQKIIKLIKLLFKVKDTKEQIY